MRILVCNDDGIAAPGVTALADAAQCLGDDVWIVAPERKWTAASHQLSFDRDLALTRRAERTWACSGAPADCVVAAMAVLFAGGPRPDLVLAGVNDGRNVGEDIAYSGTMAIAREATFWGVPAIGFSQAERALDPAALQAALRRLLPALWQDRTQWAAGGHWLGINFPAVLPATLAVPRTAHDKIASGCDVLARDARRIAYRIRRERAGGTVPGDENALLAAGSITVVRHGWRDDAGLPAGLVERWAAAAGPPGGA